MSLGPQNPTKKLTHFMYFLSHLLSRNHVSNFSDLPPLLKRRSMIYAHSQKVVH